MEDNGQAPNNNRLQTLQRSADELTAIFESDAIGMAIVVDGKFARCNRKYERIYGYAPDAPDWQKRTGGVSQP